MNQCLNKLIESLDLLYETLFQKIIEIFARRGIIRPLIRRPPVPIIELQPIDNIKQPLTLHSCTSTPVFAKSESIYRRAESEKEFRKYAIPNLGDTINKVDSYSRDVSLLNLFDDQQNQLPHQNNKDTIQFEQKLHTIIEENKSQNHSKQDFQNSEKKPSEYKQSQEPEHQNIQQQQIQNISQEQEEQFYSIIDNQNKITQNEQFYSIIDKSSFRVSFNKSKYKK